MYINYIYKLYNSFKFHRENLKSQITKRNGTILDAIPTTINSTNSTDRVGNSNFYILSHPKDFRKPNYLLAVASGICMNIYIHSSFIYTYTISIYNIIHLIYNINDLYIYRFANFTL